MVAAKYECSPDDAVMITQMAEASKSLTDIAAALGVHRDTALRCLTEMGLDKHLPGSRKHKWTEAERAEVRAKIAAGTRVVDVARDMGLTRKQVAFLVDHMLPDVRVPGARITDAQRAEIRRLGALSWDTARIAAAVGLSKSAVQRMLPREKIIHPDAEATRAAVAAKLADGVSQKDIAAGLGWSKNRISAYVKREGLTKEKRPPAAPVYTGPTLETTGEPPGILNGQRLAGWREIIGYWRGKGGRGFPSIGAVNELRRSENPPRAPYKPMKGRLAA